MKKMLFLFLTVSLLFAGCSKDKNDGFNYDKESLYGTWRITHTDTGSGYIDVTIPPYLQVMGITTATFNSDGTYSGRGYFGNGSGTYVAKGNTVTCYVGGEEYVKYDVLSLGTDLCELKMIMGSSDMLIKCKKQ